MASTLRLLLLLVLLMLVMMTSSGEAGFVKKIVKNLVKKPTKALKTFVAGGDKSITNAHVNHRPDIRTTELAVLHHENHVKFTTHLSREAVLAELNSRLSEQERSWCDFHDGSATFEPIVTSILSVTEKQEFHYDKISNTGQYSELGVRSARVGTDQVSVAIDLYTTAVTLPSLYGEHVTEFRKTKAFLQGPSRWNQVVKIAQPLTAEELQFLQQKLQKEVQDLKSKRHEEFYTTRGVVRASLL